MGYIHNNIIPFIAVFSHIQYVKKIKKINKKQVQGSEMTKSSGDVNGAAGRVGLV